MIKQSWSYAFRWDLGGFKILPPQGRLALKEFQGQLFLPDFKKSICGVMPTAFELLGLPVPTETAQYSFFKWDKGKKTIKQNILDHSDAPRHVINVLIDSWGIGNLSTNPDLAKLVRELRSFLVSSVFPTITSAAVTSWHMGVPPSTHGILGHKILFQEVGAVVDTLKMRIISGQGGRDSLVRTGIRPEAWLWCTPLYNELVGSGVLHFELLSQSFAGTGLSHFFHPKTKTIIVGCNGLVDLFATARELLVRTNHKRKLLINIYLSEFDWLAHKFHPQSVEGAEYLKCVGNTLKWFLYSTPETFLKETVITLSADHGQVDVAQAAPVSFSQSQQDFMRKNLLRAIPGRSGRVIHFYTKPGKEDNLIAYLDEVVDTRGIVVSTEQVPFLLNVNTVSELLISRLGNVMILLEPGIQFEFESKHEEFEASKEIEESLVDFPMKGSHGSLSFDELAVPYITSLGTRMKDVLLTP